MAKIAVVFTGNVDRINMWIAKCTAFLVIPAAGVLLYGVTLRYIFNKPVAWEGEIAWLLFVGFSLLSGAYVLRRDGHVRLDVLYSRFSPRNKAIMDVVTSVFFFLFVGTMVWLTVDKALWSISELERSTHSSFHTPVFVARTCLALSSILLLLQGISGLINQVRFIAGNNTESRVD